MSKGQHVGTINVTNLGKTASLYLHAVTITSRKDLKKYIESLDAIYAGNLQFTSDGIGDYARNWSA